MGQVDLVLGLLPGRHGPGQGLRETLRDLTITWSRYGYRDAILEAASVEAILDAAAERGHRYCLIQRPGILIRESWQAQDDGRDFLAALVHWCDKHEFLAVGSILAEDDRWFGLDDRCLVVDVARWGALGRPRFGAAESRLCDLPGASPWRDDDGALRALEPSGAADSARPGLPGWGFAAAALAAGLAVPALDARLRRQFLDVAPADTAGAERFARALGAGIARHPEEDDGAGLTPDQRELLDVAALHARNARRGVFLWNIEPYDDVEQPPAGFEGPVSRLYSVAAGFKPNRILATHGCDPDTVVVFFDYSQKALDVRRDLVTRWDGRDFPREVARLFERFPYPETWYHLWRDLTPSEVAPAELDAAWQRELARWGGEAAFARHWSTQSGLRHEFVHCDVVGEPAPLLERLAPDPSAVIWWSNAFFTVLSNWHHPWSERRDRYEAFASQLAERNPDLLLYGSDHNNTNVNCIRAGAYLRRYRELPGDQLVPRVLRQVEIRM